MQKLIFTSFGAHTPEAPTEIHKPAWKMPSAIKVGNEFEFDFAPLVIVDQIVLDKLTVDYVNLSGLPYLGRLRNTLNALIQEGFVDVIDFGSIASKYAIELAQATDEALQSPSSWLPAIRKQLKIWRDSQPEWQEILGKEYNGSVIPSSYGVYCYLKTQTGGINEVEVTRLTKLFYSERANWSGRDAGELSRILRPYLSYTHLNLALSEILGCPFIDWIDMRPLYEAKYRSVLKHLNNETNHRAQTIEKAHQLFKVALPELIPKTSTSIVRLLKDRRIREVRKCINEAIAENREFTQDWGQDIKNAAIDAQMKAARVRNLITWIGRAISLIPGLGLASILAEETAGAVASRKTLQKYKWLYSLVEHKSSERSR
jgi:hypothetical protein